jgi:transcriptional antiterminator RfaH
MTDWHVALTIPQSDRFACESLRQRGYLVYRPIFPKLIRHFRNGPNRSRSVIRPLFPGYLFVADERGQGWWGLEQCPGLRPEGNLLKFAGSLDNAIVPPLVMERIRATEQQLCTTKLTLAKTHGFEVGQQVRIEEGPFTGLFAQIETLDGSERVGLLLSLFGRDSRVSLPAEHLASAS